MSGEFSNTDDTISRARCHFISDTHCRISKCQSRHDENHDNKCQRQTNPKISKEELWSQVEAEVTTMSGAVLPFKTVTL